MKLRLVFAFEPDQKPGPWVSAADWHASWLDTLGTLCDGSVGQALVAGWLHTFLWGLCAADRARILSALLGRAVSEAEVEPLPRHYGLKGWEDFPDDYPQAPIRVELAS